MWLPLPAPAIILKYICADWNTKYFCVSSSSNWLLESNGFSFSNSCLTSKCFDLFAVIFLLRLDNLASKSAFVIKFVFANLPLKTSAAKVLNSGVIIYLSLLGSVSFFSISVTFTS